MRYLAEGMDSCIGAACAMQPGLRAQKRKERRLHGALNCGLARLQLPACIIAAIVGKRKFKAQLLAQAQARDHLCKFGSLGRIGVSQDFAGLLWLHAGENPHCHAFIHIFQGLGRHARFHV